MSADAAAPPQRRIRARLLLIAVLVAIGAVIVQRWQWSRAHVSTDNAQIEGHIVPIAAREAGYVLDVPAADNQPVSKDDLLVELDSRDYAVKLAQANADYSQAVAAAGSGGQLGQAMAQVGAAQANAAAAGAQTGSIAAQIVEAQANVDKARRDLVRTQELAGQKMLSPSSLDTAETAVKAANARLSALSAQLVTVRESAAAAGQQIGVSTAGLKVAQAKVLATESALQLARNQLTDTRVLAPVNGIVSKKSVEPGQMISTGQTLMYLVPTDQLWVTANLKETELLQIKPGQPVDIEVDAYPGLRLSGHVDSFSPATGARFTLLPPDNATGNFTKVVQRVPVKISLDALPVDRQLRPGLSVSVVIATR